MTVPTKFCVDCSKKNDRGGICCISCLGVRKKKVIKRFQIKHKERIKEIRRKYRLSKRKKCPYCGIKIWMDSTRCRHCVKYTRKKALIKTDKTGYVQIYKPDHLGADHKGYVREHRLVVEKKIKRYLKPKEVVHHINGNQSDNRIENLMLFETHKKHMQFHTKIIQFGYTGIVLKQIKNRWKEM